jgi:hypothetical protein
MKKIIFILSIILLPYVVLSQEHMKFIVNIPLNFDDSSCKMYGDADEVKKLIRQFVQLHPTNGEKEFKRLSKMPHKKAKYGVFEELPKELEVYRR